MTTPIFRARRLGHVNLFVDDVARSTAFYRDVCGLAVQFTEHGLKAQFLGTGHTPHDLGMIETTKGVDRFGKDGHLQIPGSIGQVPALNHLAWELETEVDLVDGIHRCRDAGIAIRRLADHQIAHSAYLPDTDGNPLEFYVDTIRDWRSLISGDLDLITSIWDPDAAPPVDEPMYEPNPELATVDGAPVHPIRLGHAVLATDDVGGLARFYRDVAGLTPVHEGPSLCVLRSAHLADGFDLALVPAGGGVEAGLHHFAFELAAGSDIASLAARLSASGVSVERTWRDATKSSIFLIDPDGWRVEFLVRPSGASWSADIATAELPYSI